MADATDLMLQQPPVGTGVPLQAPIDKQMLVDLFLRTVNCMAQEGHVKLGDKLTGLCRVTRVDELLWDAVSRHKLGREQSTRLMYAAHMRDPTRVKFLCDRGAVVTTTILKHAHDEKSVKAMLEVYPEIAKELDCLGALPLHHACADGKVHGVISALLAVYPGAAQQWNIKPHLRIYFATKLPLHIACEKNAEPNVVKILLAAYPKAASISCTLEMLPLHIACENGAVLDAVTILLAAYPEAVSKSDMCGRLPLHIACEKEASLDVVKMLLAAHPDAAGERDMDGRLPFHYTCNEEVLKALLPMYPEAVREKDKLGKLPLHYAREKNATQIVLEMLM